ncbi:calcium-binding protein CML35 [Tripterygium wilfordii]|uniref:Calcium-binding protein CML35 n=1 Tax=Tripterygium wilfordii TaxID=458696 RepID=A0A7J7DV56_TRIWF|nr:probable calcium-binding protein CML36 [Tripterygium wilfordii]KAF5750260.1 calcium-binding protein CML35 [Tripterygium wilfordii]
MTLIKFSKLSPKRLFRSKKDRSMVSRSDPSSFSFCTSSSSSSDTSDTHHKPRSTNVGADVGTPTSVLPEVSGDWSDIYGELVQAFKIIDRDNDGIVSRSELEALLSRLGAQPPSREEVATMVREVDSDGDGCISVEALMSRIGSAYEPACDAELREAFEFFDTDRDGSITAEELQGVFAAIGDDRCTLDDCRRMIAGVDKNGDGFVCFDDFCRMMELQA